MQTTHPISKTKRSALGFVRLGNRLENIEYIIGCFALLLFLVVVFLNVVFREFFTPLVWAEEVSRFGYVWAIFLGSGIAIRHGSHFTIDMVVNCFHGKQRAVLDFIDDMVITIFVSYLFYYGVQFALMSSARTSFPSGISLIYATICIPLGAIFMVYFMVEKFVLLFSGLKFKEAEKLLEKEGAK